MYKVIKNLNALTRYLDNKYGVDKADEILLNEYNYRRIHEAKQGTYLEGALQRLRVQWTKFNRLYKTLDKRTKEARANKARMDEIVKIAEGIKQQIEEA